MRRLPHLLLLAIALLVASTGWSDTIILKSGEKLAGKVVSETTTEYTVDYQAAAGIMDTRTVLKTDVEKIEKEKPDDLAWQSLKNLKPGASSLPVSGYEGPMRVLQSFVTQYPESPHASDAAQALLAFDEDKKRVDAGEVKIDGRWISKEEVQKERYQINGRAIYSYMQDLARRNDLVGALNAFDQLEKNYPGSSAFPDAAGLARQLVERLKSLAEQTLKNWQGQKAERDNATKMMPESQRAPTLAAQKREEQQLDVALDTATKGGAKWPPFQRQHEKTLTAIISKTAPELTRLGNLPVEKMRQSLHYSQQARTEFAKPDLEAADAALREATKLWGANEIAVRLTKEVAAQKALVKAATPVRVAASTAATPAVKATPAATPVVAKVQAPLPPPPEPPKSFFSTPTGLGVLALAFVVLGAGYFTYKKKKQAAAHDLG